MKGMYKLVLCDIVLQLWINGEKRHKVRQMYDELKKNLKKNLPSQCLIIPFCFS